MSVRSQRLRKARAYRVGIETILADAGLIVTLGFRAEYHFWKDKIKRGCYVEITPEDGSRETIRVYADTWKDLYKKVVRYRKELRGEGNGN